MERFLWCVVVPTVSTVLWSVQPKCIETQGSIVWRNLRLLATDSYGIVLITTSSLFSKGSIIFLQCWGRNNDSSADIVNRYAYLNEPNKHRATFWQHNYGSMRSSEFTVERNVETQKTESVIVVSGSNNTAQISSEEWLTSGLYHISQNSERA
jgi:hypothetical protein